MSSLRRRSGSKCVGAVILVVPMLLASPLSAASAQTAVPSASKPSGGPFDGLLRALDLKANVSAAPDFVVKSRPPQAKIDYLPVGTRHPERAVKVLTPAEVAATETELDAARITQQRRAGMKPAPVPDKPKKTAAKPLKTVR